MSDCSWHRHPLWQILTSPKFQKPFKLTSHEWSDWLHALISGRATLTTQDSYARQLLELSADSRPGSREPIPDVRMTEAWDDFMLQFSWYLYVQPVVYSLCNLLKRFSRRKCLFFVTKLGLGGLCMPGAKVGDEVGILFRKMPGCIEVPFVVRNRSDSCYSMVSVAHVADDWKSLAGARGTFNPQQINLR